MSGNQNAAGYEKHPENDFFRAFKNSPAAMSITRMEDGKFLTVNRMFTRIMEYPPDAILGRTARDIDLYANPRERDLLVQQLQADGTIQEYELQLKTRSGETKTLLVSMEPTVYEKAAAVISTFIDLTERKQMEAALRKSEERFRSIFQNHAAVKLLIDPATGDIVQANDAAGKFYGWSPAALMKMRIQDINIQQPGQVAAEMEKARSLHRTYFEFQHRLADGSVRDVEVYSSRVEVDGKALLHSIVHDITQKKQAEEHLKQAQKMEAMGTLAGGIAHDFNNILFPIIGHADMLLEDLAEDSPFRASLEQIHTGAQRARELVRQILAFSRQEKNEPAMMQLQPIVKEALKLIRATIPATIAIKQRLHAGCGPVNADPVQIHQIIMNLATNAYHAMAETGGTLTVSLKEVQVDTADPVSPDLQPGSYACLSVADTGAGMDKETAEKIFEPFFTTKKKEKGTGMGLSVVHGIVKAMNGTIAVQTAPGRGTLLQLFMPIADNRLQENAPLAKVPPAGGSERILLVDDEKAVIAIEKQLLSRLGYQVTGCTGSVEALEMFTADPDRFDAVITDIAMPTMPGDKLARELLKIRPDIPILLCTGFSDTMTDEKMASIGVKGLLMKPIVINELDRKLREIFG